MRADELKGPSEWWWAGGVLTPGNTCEVEIKGGAGQSQLVGHQWKFSGLDATIDLKQASQAASRGSGEGLNWARLKKSQWTSTARV